MTSRLVEPGELVAVGTPLVVIIDLDHAWANVYVEEPLVPRLANRSGGDGHHRRRRSAGRTHRVHLAARGVHAAQRPDRDERAKLVYRVKVAVDNRQGVLKPGMPVEVGARDAGRHDGSR